MNATKSTSTSMMRISQPTPHSAIFRPVPLAIVIGALGLSFAGCRTEHHGYVPQGEVHFGNPETMTLSDMDRIVNELVGKFLSNASFKRDYKETEARLGGKRPVLQIGNFENLVSASDTDVNPRDFTPILEIARAKTEELLQNSELFRFINDENSAGSDTDDLNDGLRKGSEEGMTGGRNIQRAGEYTEADYRMLGEFRPVDGGNRHSFVLRIRIYSHWTRERWTFTSRIIKE